MTSAICWDSGRGANQDGQPITDRLAVADQAVLRRQQLLDPEWAVLVETHRAPDFLHGLGDL